MSSATIRNEMADLEEMGYLIQPHTSAGRIPSDEGYRFYVNSLMRKYKIGMEAVAQLQSVLETRVSQLEKLIRYAGAIASNLTEYTTVVTAPKEQEFEINKIDLVPIATQTVMLIVVTRTVRNKVMNIDIDSATCMSLANILNEHLAGLKAGEITFDKIQDKIGKENDFEILQDCSLVTINYSLGNKKAGKIGVIGPKRMNYSKVFASLDLISNEIDKILNEYISDE